MELNDRYSWYLTLLADRKKTNGTFNVKLSGKTKMKMAVFATIYAGCETKAEAECTNMFGGHTKASVLPKLFESPDTFAGKYYGNFKYLAVRVSEGGVYCNKADTGDDSIESEKESFKRRGNSYILKVTNWLYTGNKKLYKLAKITYTLKPCKDSAFGLKITKIKINKLSNYIG